MTSRKMIPGRQARLQSISLKHSAALYTSMYMSPWEQPFFSEELHKRTKSFEKRTCAPPDHSAHTLSAVWTPTLKPLWSESWEFWNVKQSWLHQNKFESTQTWTLSLSLGCVEESGFRKRMDGWMSGEKVCFVVEVGGAPAAGFLLCFSVFSFWCRTFPCTVSWTTLEH